MKIKIDAGMQRKDDEDEKGRKGTKRDRSLLEADWRSMAGCHLLLILPSIQ